MLPAHAFDDPYWDAILDKPIDEKWIEILDGSFNPEIEEHQELLLEILERSADLEQMFATFKLAYNGTEYPEERIRIKAACKQLNRALDKLTIEGPCSSGRYGSRQIQQEEAIVEALVGLDYNPLSYPSPPSKNSRPQK